MQPQTLHGRTLKRKDAPRTPSIESDSRLQRWVRRRARHITGLVWGVLACLLLTAQAVAQIQPQTGNDSEIAIAVLDGEGDTIDHLVDGNTVRLSLTLDEPAAADKTFSLLLEPDEFHLADCTFATGATECMTGDIVTTGWYWDEAGGVRTAREVYAIDYEVSGWLPVATTTVEVSPRPVILLHGYTSTYSTWEAYLGPAGYLAQSGLPGYAVGDGQAPGAMLTGNKFRPAQTTNTIAQNAEIVADYIDAVKAETGAEQVDIIGHSMGGLIARYYIARLMEARDVAQLIKLGTPNAGSDCAVMAGHLGIYHPASLELRTSYLQEVFNPQIVETRDVPFYLVAGTPIQQRIFSPCGDVPNDLMVALDSALALGTPYVELSVLHKDLNEDEAVYFDYVAPLLRQSPQELTRPRAEMTIPDVPEREMLQFSQVITGTISGLPAGEAGNAHTIHIDREVVVASFGIYDPSRSITVTVQGAAGNVIELEPDIHGLQTITDPESLFYLGYGFENPGAGPWVVTVHATERTPPLGTEYALITLYAGGARVDATLDNPLPQLGETVAATATLLLGDEPLAFDRSEVTVHLPDGSQTLLNDLAGAESATVEAEEGVMHLNLSLTPEAIGIYGIDVSLGATLPDGTVAERTIFLAFETIVPRLTNAPRLTYPPEPGSMEVAWIDRGTNVDMALGRGPDRGGMSMR